MTRCAPIPSGPALVGSTVMSLRHEDRAPCNWLHLQTNPVALALARAPQPGEDDPVTAVKETRFQAVVKLC